MRARPPERAGWPFGLALAACLAACSSPPPPSAASAAVTVLAIGDSITHGEMSGAVAAGDRPYLRVADDLLADGEFRIVELGCSGSSSLDWIPGAPGGLCPGLPLAGPLYDSRVRPNLPAEIATLMLGTNDAQGFLESRPVRPKEYQTALGEVVDQLFADGVGQVVLMTPPPQPCANFAVRLRLRAYRNAVSQLCTTRPSVVCGPNVHDLLGPSDFDGCDVHPNAAGHRKIGQALAATLAGPARLREARRLTRAARGQRPSSAFTSAAIFPP